MSGYNGKMRSLGLIFPYFCKEKSKVMSHRDGYKNIYFNL